MTKTREQYRAHGERYGSGDVSEEAHGAATRWGEDIEVLRRYGFPRARLDAFAALVAEHDNLRAVRPEAVSAKTTAVKGARKTIREAHQWLDRAYSNLRAVSLEHDDVAADIEAIGARSKDGIDAEVAACVAAVAKHQARMPEDTEPAALVSDGEALAPRLKALGPGKRSAKDAAKDDTEDLDVLDGRLLEVIAAVNNAGRKAFRALGNKARVEAYKYHVISGKPSATRADAPADPPAPTP